MKHLVNRHCLMACPFIGPFIRVFFFFSNFLKICNPLHVHAICSTSHLNCQHVPVVTHRACKRNYYSRETSMKLWNGLCEVTNVATCENQEIVILVKMSNKISRSKEKWRKSYKSGLYYKTWAWNQNLKRTSFFWSQTSEHIRWSNDAFNCLWV